MSRRRACEEAALIARGKALPEDRRLVYVSEPTPTSQRWVFHGHPEVLLSYEEAYTHILAVEREVELAQRASERT